MASDNPVITIDGPAAAGKGTLAHQLSAELNFHLLDSGLLYRIVGYAAKLAGLDIHDAAKLESFTRDRLVFKINEKPSDTRSADLFEVYLFKYVGLADTVRINDMNVNVELRSRESGINSSVVSVFPEVRRCLIPIQRSTLQPPGLVADGRDMGTVVFPDAPLKFFLNASVKERAHRRRDQLAAAGEHVSLEELEAELKARDERDTNRDAAPLIPARDAITFDTTNMTIDEMVRSARATVFARLAI